MKTIAAALAILTAGTVLASAQGIRSGNDLKELCGIAARGPRGNDLEPVKASFCQGFVTTFMLVGRHLEAPVHFCIPKGVTLGQAIDVLLKYLNDHPSELHQPAELLTILAYREAWRCP